MANPSDRKAWSPRAGDMKGMTTKEVLAWLRDVAAEVENFMPDEWSQSIYDTANAVEATLKEQDIGLNHLFFPQGSGS